MYVCMCVWGTQTTTGLELEVVSMLPILWRQAHHTYLTQRSYGMMGEARVGHSGVPAGDRSKTSCNASCIWCVIAVALFLVNQQQGNPSLLKTSINVLSLMPPLSP